MNSGCFALRANTCVVGWKKLGDVSILPKGFWSSTGTTRIAWTRRSSLCSSKAPCPPTFAPAFSPIRYVAKGSMLNVKWSTLTRPTLSFLKTKPSQTSPKGSGNTPSRSTSTARRQPESPSRGLVQTAQRSHPALLGGFFVSISCLPTLFLPTTSKTTCSTL